MKTLQLRARSAAKRAFTLIEIMVATVIMVVLVGLVIQITSEVLKVWTRSSGKLSANAEARIALDLITQDLETAVFRNNGQQWLRVEAPKNSGLQILRNHIHRNACFRIGRQLARGTRPDLQHFAGDLNHQTDEHYHDDGRHHDLNQSKGARRRASSSKLQSLHNQN